MLQVWLVLIAIWASYMAFNINDADTVRFVFGIGSIFAVAMSIILFFANGGTTG